MTDMQKEFARCLRLGLGRCTLILANCGDVNEFKDGLIRALKNNPTPYTQQDGTRAKYLYKLTEFFDDKNIFIEAVISEIRLYREDNGWTFYHLCDLLGEFAAHGSRKAYAALQDEYRNLYEIILHRAESDDGYDGANDNFEQVAVTLLNVVSASPKQALADFVYCVDDLGRLISFNKKYCALDFEYYYYTATYIFGKERVEKAIKRVGKKLPFVATFKKSLEKDNDGTREKVAPAPKPTPSEIIDSYDGSSSPYYYRYIITQNADGGELFKLAQKVKAAESDGKRANLLRLFGGDCPVPDGELTVYAASGNRALKEAALDLISNRKSDGFCDLTAMLLNCSCNLKYYGLCLVIKNYGGDGRAFFENADGLFDRKDECKDDYDLTSEGLREIVLETILDEFEDGETSLPDSFLTFVYENALMFLQRRRAIQLMHERGCLTRETVGECAYDCDGDIRALAEIYAEEF